MSQTQRKHFSNVAEWRDESETFLGSLYGSAYKLRYGHSTPCTCNAINPAEKVHVIPKIDSASMRIRELCRSGKRIVVMRRHLPSHYLYGVIPSLFVSAINILSSCSRGAKELFFSYAVLILHGTGRAGYTVFIYLLFTRALLQKGKACAMESPRRQVHILSLFMRNARFTCTAEMIFVPKLAATGHVTVCNHLAILPDHDTFGSTKN